MNNPMKKIYLSFITVLLVALTAVSCQQDDELKGNVGYLRIEVGTNAYVDTRSVPEDYNPKQIALQILDSSNEVVKETDDWEELKGQQLRLTPGTYTIKASSNGFDGSESGFDIPYYAGSQQVTIESGKEETANITCTLANVKVTVNYDESFRKFASATATVASELKGVAALDFAMGNELKPGYFPVGNLNVTVKVTNQSGQSHSQTTEITDVKARKHYILNFKVADAGGINKPTVTIDGEEITYTFQFNVSTEATTQLEAASANAWSNFAYVEGSVLSAESELDPTAMRFEYKTADADEWTTVTAANEGGNYKATLTALAPATTYVYRMAYEKGEENYVSDEVSFTTEAATELPNGGMEDWFKDGKTYYAATSSADVFWDSGNKGANTLTEINPTRPEETDVINGKAARLGSTTAAGQFAAGSLFTGSFKSATIVPLGAKLDFGRPFTSRPSQLKGYFKYNPGKIDKIKTDKVTAVKEGDRDICSIYILLADWESAFAVSTGDNQFVDINDDSVIAYGELDSSLTSPESMSEYKEFIIDIKYRDLIRKPTYILVVCSSSKYGDYFTGSTSSVLLIDELELVYGEPVTE